VRIERRRERREVRRAKRLVANELEVCAIGLRFVAKHGVVPEMEVLEDPTFLPHGAWDTERATLATALGDEDWEAVDRAATQVAQVRRGLRWDLDQADDPSHVSLRDEHARLTERTADLADQVRELLRTAQPVTD
jgi:hypothetical protein